MPSLRQDVGATSACFLDFEAFCGAEVGACAAADALFGYLAEGGVDGPAVSSAGEALGVSLADFGTRADAEAAEEAVFLLLEVDAAGGDSVFGGEFVEHFGIGAAGHEELEDDFSGLLDAFGVGLYFESLGDFQDAGCLQPRASAADDLDEAQAACSVWGEILVPAEGGYFYAGGKGGFEDGCAFFNLQRLIVQLEINH